MFSDAKRIKLEINNKRFLEYPPNIYKCNNIFSNNPQTLQNKFKMFYCNGPNENDNIKYIKNYDAANATPTGKFIALKCFYQQITKISNH